MIPSSKPEVKAKNWDSLNPKTSPEDEVWQAKLDGAFLYYAVGKEGIRAFSYRRSKRTGEPIEHTSKLRGLNKVKPPNWLVGAILEGEAWHPKMESRHIGGILNSRGEGVGKDSLIPVLHGVTSLPGFDMGKLNNRDRLALSQQIAREVKAFTLPDSAETASEKQKLIKDIEAKKHEQTYEGIIGYPLKGRPFKAVVSPSFDEPVIGSLPSESKSFKGSGIGALLVGSPDSPTQVGTGMSVRLRKLLHEQPNLLQGLVARVQAKERFPSGKLRSPRLKDFHPEKSDPDSYKAIYDAMKKHGSHAPLFVYGTLRRGLENSSRLGDSKLISSGTRTATGYGLFNRNNSPAMASGAFDSQVVGDVYNVSGETLESIASYEADNQGQHRPSKIKMEDGSEAVAFTIPEQEARKWKMVRSGNWMDVVRPNTTEDVQWKDQSMASTKLAKEFAPGIPADRKIRRIPKAEGKWHLTVHQHDAHRAGSHYDLRLADPETGHAHSWALPAADLPVSRSGERHGHVRLAVQQPTHTMDYMKFQGEIPSGTYGAGSVTIVHKGKVPVVASKDRVLFRIPKLGKFVLKRKDDKNWLLIKMLDGKREKTARDIALNSFLEKMAEFLSGNSASMKTRLTPLRSDSLDKLKRPYTIESPSRNVISTGKADTGIIGGAATSPSASSTWMTPSGPGSTSGQS